MRKKVVFLFLAVMLGICGCQPAPEAAGDSDVFRAKGSEDEQVQSIMEQGKDVESRYKEGDWVQVLLGEGDNRIRIDARLPAVKKAPGALIMRADTDMDEDMLWAFLEPQGEVRDMTQEYLENWERQNEQALASSIAAGEGPQGIQKMGSIGDPDFCIVLTDGNRTVNGEDQFFVSYEDAASRLLAFQLYELCERLRGAGQCAGSVPCDRTDAGQSGPCDAGMVADRFRRAVCQWIKMMQGMNVMQAFFATALCLMLYLLILGELLYTFSLLLGGIWGVACMFLVHISGCFMGKSRLSYYAVARGRNHNSSRQPQQGRYRHVVR